MVTPHNALPTPVVLLYTGPHYSPTKGVTSSAPFGPEYPGLLLGSGLSALDPYLPYPFPFPYPYPYSLLPYAPSYVAEYPPPPPPLPKGHAPPGLTGRTVSERSAVTASGAAGG